MGWRWRKVFRSGPVTTTVTTKGVGWSIGIRGLRYGISPTGRRYISVGVPGTGLYWTKYLDGRDPTKSWRKIDMEQTPFEPGKIGFADNPEPRCASVLLLRQNGSYENVRRGQRSRFKSRPKPKQMPQSALNVHAQISCFGFNLESR
jgi:hypothetical protein